MPVVMPGQLKDSCSALPALRGAAHGTRSVFSATHLGFPDCISNLLHPCQYVTRLNDEHAALLAIRHSARGHSLSVYIGIMAACAHRADCERDDSGGQARRS